MSFAERYGYAPHGTWSAPGRANLIGEHTDYNEGFVLPFAIDRRTTVQVAPRQDRVLRVASTFADEVVEVAADDLAPGALTGWSAYPLGVAWALGRMGTDLSAVPGADLFIDSDVPIGAGLSSSAAIESAVAVALNDLWSLGFDRRTLARAGQLAENEAVGAPTGIMDQSASLLGRADHAVFLDCRSLHSELVELGFAAAGLELLVIDTHVKHSHATGGYGERRASCESGAARLQVPSLRHLGVDDLPHAQRVLDELTFRRVRHIVSENQRVLDTVRLLRERGPLAIGPLLNASHESMRDDFEISAPELDVAVETAQRNGAVGARMTGGGFGGAAVALVPGDAAGSLTDAVLSAFAAHGFTAPAVFPVRAADGARRDS